MAEGTSKVLKAPTGPHPIKKLPAHNGKGKKPVVTSANRPAATVTKPAYKSAASLNQHPDTVDLDTSDQEETAEEGDRGDVDEIAAILKIGTSSTLSLHNSFDISNEDGELPIGEARQAELEANHIPNGELIEKPVMFDIGPKELANLTQVVHSKLLVDLENKLQTETLSSNLTTPV